MLKTKGQTLNVSAF